MGKMIFDGEDLLAKGVNLKQLRRRIGMVFQSYNLYPHMTALGNVRLALRHVLKMKRAEADARAEAQLDRVGLSVFSAQYPAQLSGGQQQRVAIAKNTALGMVIGVGELLNQATTAQSFAGNATPLTMTTIAYLILFIPVVYVGRKIETRYAWRRA